MWEMKKKLQPERLHAHPVDVPTDPAVTQQMRECDSLTAEKPETVDSTTQGLIQRPHIPGQPASLEAWRVFENSSEDEPTIILKPPVGSSMKYQMKEEGEGYDIQQPNEPEGDAEAIDDLRS